MREQIPAVMRWAGPRMLVCHRVMAIGHAVAGCRAGADVPGQESATSRLTAGSANGAVSPANVGDGREAALNRLRARQAARRRQCRWFSADSAG